MAFAVKPQKNFSETPGRRISLSRWLGAVKKGMGRRFDPEPADELLIVRDVSSNASQALCRTGKTLSFR